MAETQSEHWLSRSWRPLLMLLLMGFLLLVGVILPLADLVAGHHVPFEPRWQSLPEGFWQFLCGRRGRLYRRALAGEGGGCRAARRSKRRRDFHSCAVQIGRARTPAMKGSTLAMHKTLLTLAGALLAAALWAGAGGLRSRCRRQPR